MHARLGQKNCLLSKCWCSAGSSVLHWDDVAFRISLLVARMRFDPTMRVICSRSESICSQLSDLDLDTLQRL